MPPGTLRLARRKQLASFLRAKRGLLGPEDVGLGAGQRRRTPGLRREEVALLAGVSVTWYTWLEQARAINVSREVLAGIAGALTLNGAERRHLFGLAGQTLPAGAVTDPPSEALRALVLALDPSPAYLVNARGDLLAWNDSEVGLIGDPDLLDDSERNVIWLLFTDTRQRQMIIDWPRQAQRVLADYRVEAAQRPDDPGFAALTDALYHASEDFRTWWDDHTVVDLPAPRLNFNHPTVGRLDLTYTKLLANATPEIRLVGATPNDDVTRQNLPRLAELGKHNRA